MQIIRSIQNRIYEVRHERVMLDRDLAALYETETKAFNQAVKRNIDRFPDDFMFTSGHNVFSKVSVLASPISLPKKNMIV